MTKCYYVYISGGDEWDYNQLVWADTPGQAKSKSWLPMEIDWTEIKTRRIPLLDDIPNPTDKELLDAGFTVICRGCRLVLYDCHNFDQHDNAFCENCAEAAQRWLNALKQLGNDR